MSALVPQAPAIGKFSRAQADEIIRTRWMQEAKAVDIAEELGYPLLGDIGARVLALGLPLKNHRGELIPPATYEEAAKGPWGWR